MPSLGSILHIASTGLRTMQEGMNVTAHNIANASTEGYSRQRPIIDATPGLVMPNGVFGTGTAVYNVEQIRDVLLDGTYYSATSGANRFDARAGMLGRIEGLFVEPTDQGLDAALDRFYSAWSGLATTPNNPTLRSVVRETAIDVVSKLQDLAGNLDALRREVDTRLQDATDRVNALSRSIADLNVEIVAAESGGAMAGDLRDQRARALSELSELIPIQVSYRDFGSIGVTSNGLGIIDGANALELEIRVESGQVGMGAVGRPGLFGEVGGTVGGLLEVLNTDLASARQGLDDLVSALVTEVNALHRTGTGPDGTTGLDFFDPAGLSASTIALSGDVLASLGAIAAGTPDGAGGYRAGANDVALAMAGIRDSTLAPLGSTIREHYQGLVSDVGQAIRSSSEAADVHRILADQADVRRMSLSGVSVDEELVNMIEFQRAYQASARMISAADEMIQSLLAI